MSIKKISISPKSSNYNDNDENVAYLYRGYIIWKYTNEFGPRSGRSDEWHFAPAVLHAPNAALGEAFEPYWDNDGDTESAGTRRDCVRIIDTYFEQGIAKINPGYDPDDAKTVTLAVSLNEARTILAALSRRHDELCDTVSSPGRDETRAAAASLLAEVKSAYQSIDQQAFGQKPGFSESQVSN